jgi:hypothetical protein
MTIQDNIRRANEGLAAVKAHCMALTVEVTKHHLIVMYGPGYRCDGIRLSLENGLANACERAIARMEIHWAGGL